LYIDETEDENYFVVGGVLVKEEDTLVSIHKKISKIIITTSHDTYTYEYLNVDYSYGYENKTVPIWVQEDS